MQYKSHIADFILYKNGEDGNTPYVHIKYSDDGGATFTSNNGEDTGDYLGIYTDFTEADSTDVSSYKWTKIKGDQGIEGAVGADGKTTYFHVKYSEVAEPTTSDEMTETPSKYIGTYVDYTEDDSDDPADYKWSQFIGDDGIAGQNGADGLTSYLHIKYSDDGGSTFTSDDGETVGDYIGQYVDFTEADSTDVSSYKWSKIKGSQGARGEGGLSYRITSSLGMAFLEGQTDTTTLTAYMYAAGDEIDAEGVYEYGWICVDHDGIQTTLMETAAGNKSIDISVDNIAGKSVYFVAVNPDLVVSDNSSETGVLSAPIIYLTYDDEYVTVQGTFQSPYFDFICYKNGEDGTSVTILGSYDSEEELNTAHPTGSAGDAYLVAGDMYVWNGTEWHNVGTIQGPQGDTGTSVDSITAQYYLSTSKTEQVNGEWVATMPEWTTGTYLWIRYEIVYKDPESTSYTEPQCDTSWESLGNLESRVTVTETAITETNEAITLLATKEEMETAVSEIDTRLSSAEASITVNAEAIETKASTTEVSALTSRIITAESKITQNADSIALEITSRTEATDSLESKTEALEALATDTDTNFNNWATQYSKHFTFTDNGLVISSGNSAITLTIDNENGIVFSKNNTAFGVWDGDNFYTGNIIVEVNERAQFGNFAYVPRSDGSLMFLKVGDTPSKGQLSAPVITLE